MKLSQIFVASVFASSILTVAALEHKDQKPGNVLSKVKALLSNLQTQITEETKREAKANEDYTGYCDETQESTTGEIGTAQAAFDKANSAITTTLAMIESVQGQIDDFASEMTVKSKELQDAKDTREREFDDYNHAYETLDSAIKNIRKAQEVIGDEMSKHSAAAFAQIDRKAFNNLIKLFSTIADAVTLPLDGKNKLTALIQSTSASSDFDYHKLKETPVYMSSSQSILDALEQLETETAPKLNELRKQEIIAKGSYNKLEGTLTAEIDTAATKKGEAEILKDKYTKELGVAQGESLKAGADLAHFTNLVKELKTDCSTWQANHAKFEKDQAAELAALKAAEEAVVKAIGVVGDGVVGVNGMASGGAAEDTSFLQTQASTELQSQLETNAQTHTETHTLAQVQTQAQIEVQNVRSRAAKKVINILRDLGHKHHESALMQLVAKIRMVVNSGGDDVFAKVKSMIREMIMKLNSKLGSLKSENEYCTTQMKKTKAQLEKLGVVIKDLDIEIETSYSREIDLSDKKADAAAHLAKDQKESNKLATMFNDASKIHILTVDELQKGLKAVHQAIWSLGEFYGIPVGTAFTQTPRANAAHSIIAMQTSVDSSAEDLKPKTTAGNGIIDMLNLVATDLADGLAEEEKTYMVDKINYEKEMKEFSIRIPLEEKDIVYYGSEYLSAHRYTGELTEDEKARRMQQKDVIVAYIKLKKQCDAKPELYHHRQAARDEELAGLREALAILSPEIAPPEALVQVTSYHGLRGLRRHAL